MLTLLIVGGVLILVSLLFVFNLIPGFSRGLNLFIGTLMLIVGMTMAAFSTSVYVEPHQMGIVYRTIGTDLPTDALIATGNQKGPQAQVLGPGWKLWIWPWIYDVETKPALTIEPGYVGVISARSGRIYNGGIFAPKWENPKEILNAEVFLEKGYRGQQLTLLPPATYRYNPILFDIKPHKLTDVPVGKVAVIKDNAGLPFTGEAVSVNGVNLVPQGYQGIWSKALLPGAYPLHPDAHKPTFVQTTQRVYTYQRVNREEITKDGKRSTVQYDESIRVRSKDGFTFPVDTRIEVSISADDAPYLVALIGDPDQEIDDRQEGDSLQRLESILILPVVRASIRNISETLSALDFVAKRTEVEDSAEKYLKPILAKNRINLAGVYIADIGLNATPEGQALLATQTERQVALNQKETWDEKRDAEKRRAQFVQEQTVADQQKELAIARLSIERAKEDAKAAEERAKGEAAAYRELANAKGEVFTSLVKILGQEGVVQLELLKLVAEHKIQITPNVMLGGKGEGRAADALAATLLSREVQKNSKPETP